MGVIGFVVSAVFWSSWGGFGGALSNQKRRQQHDNRRTVKRLDVTTAIAPARGVRSTPEQQAAWFERKVRKIEKLPLVEKKPRGVWRSPKTFAPVVATRRSR